MRAGGGGNVNSNLVKFRQDLKDFKILFLGENLCWKAETNYLFEIMSAKAM